MATIFPLSFVRDTLTVYPVSFSRRSLTISGQMSLLNALVAENVEINHSARCFLAFV